MSSRQALGRGLGALIPSIPKEESGKKPESGERVVEVPVDEIKPSRFQPRTVFNEAALKDLASSIQEKGVIQPVILTKKQNGYELIAGERRWRATKSLGIEKIPAVVRIVRDADALEMAIIENIQRENLNPIEEAYAYSRLMNEFAFTQEAMSKKVGKSRSAVANFLRLLKLPENIQDDLSDGRLSMGHARALLSLKTDKERLQMRDSIVNASLNVREVEARTSKKVKKKTTAKRDVNLERLEISIERKLGAKITITPKGKGGEIKIRYSDNDELERILSVINR